MPLGAPFWQRSSLMFAVGGAQWTRSGLSAGFRSRSARSATWSNSRFPPLPPLTGPRASDDRAAAFIDDRWDESALLGPETAMHACAVDVQPLASVKPPRARRERTHTSTKTVADLSPTALAVDTPTRSIGAVESGAKERSTM